MRQPFANQILQGIKSIELRNWQTAHRGKLYIYSEGYVIGRVILQGIKSYNGPEDFLKDKDKHLSENYYRYGWILKNPMILKEPKRVKPNVKIFTF